ncbi:hypothetical protein QYE76_010572 [Lolium multiflorum]|uniref:Transposase (putative) gypsy type domain-containing protein n=1 Tax=Lolium multiflorum TaxID=4521 RepID=A0AAD8X377_LOLMU|nr:hypothetical protein QYE76_010572 [Lolium multiflorum]
MEGLIAPDWSFMKDSITPKPDPDERVFTKAWVERGLSLPCSEFFLSVLSTYGLQPHKICPNSYLLLSNFVMLCEGHLGIRPDIHLWQVLFCVKKETKDKVMVNFGSMTFMLRPQRMYPPHSSHESVRYWNAGWFYVKNIQFRTSTRGFPNPLRVTRDNLPTDSLYKKIRTLVKILRGQEVPEIGKDIFTDNKCPPLNILAEDSFRNVIRVLASAEGAEEDLEDDDEEEEQAPKKVAPRTAKRHRAKVSGFEAGASGEASAKKAKTKPSPPLNSKKEEHERLKLLATTGKGSRPLIPGATKKVGGSCSATKRAAPEEPQDKIPEEVEVNSHDKAEAPANDAVSFPCNFGDPSNLYSTLKAYSHKFFHKMTEAEKWDLEQDMLNSMMSNAWGKADVESSEIQLHKKEISDFFDQLLVKRKEQQALHYELNKNISLQRRVTLSQAEDIQVGKERIAELEKQLAEAQGASSSLATASSELESLRSAYQDLETRLAEAEKKQERAEKQLAEKKSELLQKEADFVTKRKVDSYTLKQLQNEVNGLWNYMNTAEKGWDLLNADVMEPLGYDEDRHNQSPRDDLIRLAGDD